MYSCFYLLHHLKAVIYIFFLHHFPLLVLGLVQNCWCTSESVFVPSLRRIFYSWTKYEHDLRLCSKCFSLSYPSLPIFSFFPMTLTEDKKALATMRTCFNGDGWVYSLLVAATCSCSIISLVNLFKCKFYACVWNSPLFSHSLCGINNAPHPMKYYTQLLSTAKNPPLRTRMRETPLYPCASSPCSSPPVCQ